MMHISPCGWYCIEVDEGSAHVKDTKEKTLLNPADGSYEIELLSARKTSDALDDEISQIHEDYLSNEGVIPNRTVLSENPYGVKFYVTQGSGKDERIWIVCHAYWNNYCLFLLYHGVKDRNSHSGIQLFYNIINSIQPLSYN